MLDECNVCGGDNSTCDGPCGECGLDIPEGNCDCEGIYVDDCNGNLYSTNAYHSQSTTALSSSDNYVGNILPSQQVSH